MSSQTEYKVNVANISAQYREARGWVDKITKYRNAFPAYRVFVFGLELTNDVTSVRVQNNVGRQPNQCTLEVLNPRDKYIITRDDMKAISKLQQGVKDRTLAIINQREQFAIPDLSKATLEEIARVQPETEFYNEFSIKAKTINAKLGKGLAYTGRQVGVDGQLSVPEVFPKYPFEEGKTIFHTNDPVRVVARDPFRPEIWWWFFSGYLSDHNESYNENNQSIINLTIEDTTRTLRYARVSINPGLTDILAPLINDVNNPNQLQEIHPKEFSNVFMDMTVFQILETIFFGINPKVFGKEIVALQARDSSVLSDEAFQARWSKTKKQWSSQISAAGDNALETLVDAYSKKFKSIPLRAAGGFKRNTSEIGVDVRILGGPVSETDLVYGKPVRTLKDWQNLITHQVRIQDLSDLADPNADDPTARTFRNSDPVHSSLSSQDIIDVICSNPASFPIDGKVRVLLPANLGPNVQRDVLDRQFRSNWVQAEYFDRLNILFDAMERIDFMVSASPRGDINIELPLYDFDPDDFGSGEYDIGGGMDAETLRQIENSEQRAYPEPSDPLDTFGQADNPAAKKAQQTLGKQLFDRNDIKRIIDRVDVGKQVIDWEAQYVIEPWDVYNWSATDSDEKVRTVMMVSRRFVKAFAGFQDTGKRTPIAVVLRSLIPVYGTRIEQSDSMGFVVDEEAARVNALVRLNRLNADAFTIRTEINPRFGLSCNRPILFRSRNHIFTTVSVSHTIVWNASCSTEVNCSYSRGWTGKIDEKGRDIYTTIGGVPSRPLNYALLAQFIKKSNEGF